MFSELSRLCLKNGIDFKEEQALPCYDHIINLAVQAFLKVLEPKRRPVVLKEDDAETEPLSDLEEEDELNQEDEEEAFLEATLQFYEDNTNFINCLRSWLMKIKYSNVMVEELKLKQLQLKLKPSKIILDVRTRWNSCFYMLRWALKNKEVCTYNN